MPVPVNAAELADIAELTGGDALSAETAAEIGSVFRDLGTQLGVDVVDVELTVVAAAAAFMLLAAGAAMSLWWLGRLI